ncbi:DNA polymerase III subunit delta [Paenibacillus sp.]|uniref:DNA polymerase III subunit delta n=1 Tax=Paenibacillus sp. TaxID=58172 RepID=UPI002D67EDB3|nr:DNA polymerase III subunit delta [Paenibacillus sp.]HZG57371.1 DNA polymerase III subunit delta [Paenibacillus sp.]
MDYKQAAREWSQGTVRPMYILHGAEGYVMGEWLDLLVASCLDPDTKDFALSKYDLADTPLETAIEDAETLPFLSPRKLVIASGAYFLTGGRDPSRAEHNVDALQRYAAAPAEHATLVLTVPAEKLDERKKIVKTLKSAAVVLPFAPLGPAELQQWVAKKASGRGVRIEPDAIEALLARVGGSCAALASEMEKLSLYVGKGNAIRVEHVEALAVRTTEQNVFLLVEEIAKLRPERAISMYHDLLKEKEEPIKLLALIARQFRMMLGAKELTKQGFSQSQIASQIGAHPYAVKIAAEQAKRFRAETLERLLLELGDLDYAMKTGAVDKALGLELFILRLGAAAAAAR